MGDAHSGDSPRIERAREFGLHVHLCAIHETQEEQFAAMVLFLRSRLERGEKCLFIAEGNIAEAALDAMREAGFHVDRYIENGALEITGKHDSYLSGGSFDPKAMIAFLNRATGRAISAGYSGLCIIGDMCWALDAHDGNNKLIEYESRLNGFVAEQPAAVICQYDRSRFEPAVIRGVLCAHPLVLQKNAVSKNPYYVPADELLAPPDLQAEVERMLKHIREWNSAEQAVRNSQERLRMAFAQSSAGMAMLAADGRILQANPAFCVITGYTEEELRGTSVQAITHPNDVATDTDLIRRLLNSEIPAFAVEKRYIRKNGDVLWAQQIVGPSTIPESDDKPGNVIAIAQDITDRKQAEIERRLLASVLETTPDFIAICDLELNPVFVNRAGQELVGLNGTQEMKATKVPNYFFQGDRDYIVQQVIPALLEKGAWSGELRLRHFRTGQPIPVMVYNAVRIDDPETGRAMNFAGIARDITDRKLAEEEQQRSFEHLRALAARLQSVREEERTRVAREVHDELGQALTAIKIDLASLIRDLPADQEQSRRTDSILKFIDETIHSVRRISTELRPGILDDLGLVAAIEWASEEFEARTGIKCRLDLPQDDIVAGQGPATALFRIFQETLSNIARHANATTLDVRLGKQNGELFLEVQDNGKGVSVEEVSAGSSLGILGMRERALLLGGELTITGAPGEGTTVRVRIPGARRAGAE